MINFIKKYKDNNNVKVLLGNFISLSTIQILGMVLPLFSLPYVLRTLGFENYGIVALSSSLIMYFKTLTDYSFTITAARDVSVHRANKKAINLIFSKVMTIQTLFLIFSLLIIFILINVYKSFQNYWTIYFILSLTLIADIFYLEWFFQGIEKMKFITLTNVSVQILYTISIFVFIKSEKDLITYSLLILFSNFLNGLIRVLFLKYKFQVSFYIVDYKRIKKTIKVNFPIFINQFIPQLYNNSATFLLAFFTNNTLIGIYSATRKITDISATILNIVSRVFFPFLNRKKDAFNSYKKMFLSTTAFGILLLIVLYPLLFWIFDIENELAVYVHIFMALSLFGYAMYDVFGLNFLIVHRQDKIVMKNTIQMSIVGFLILIPLLYYWGIVGAAMTVFFTRFLLGSGVYFKALSYDWKNK